MNIKLLEGPQLSGTAEQIVRQMRELDFDTSGDLRDYAVRVAERAALLGYTIKPEAGCRRALSESLVAELLRVGLAELVP